ncbi:MAG: hypothetical protein U1E65_03620 [Myxococcota bacterium]
MDTEHGKRNTWVVANGFDEMDLSAVFLRVGVALIGPGEYGDWFDNPSVYAEKLRPGEVPLLRAFCEDVKVGDRIALRNAAHQILAVGEVSGPYRYEPIFRAVDVKGWDLQHCRRVNWKKLANPVEKSFAPNRFSHVVDPDAVSLIERLWGAQ